MSNQFWAGKRVLLTGHTGFKGSWMSLLLSELGAEVFGYSLAPETELSLFSEAGIGKRIARHEIGDIRDKEQLRAAIRSARPDIVFHLAAQALVRESYERPIETFEVNALGTAHLLDCLRFEDKTRAAVMITTDKVYENKEWVWGYRENDRLGGHDPYSASKACMELVINSYRSSFFQSNPSLCAIASARAGNVIGGGDWSKDRLICDLIRNWQRKAVTSIRYPEAVRPWQHVLEPLHAYLALAEKLWDEPKAYAEPWNFGPPESDCLPVSTICQFAKEFFQDSIAIELDQQPKPHEAHLLKLDCSKAKARLGWQSALPIERALHMTFDWYRRFYAGESARDLTIEQIAAYRRLILK